MTHVYSPSAYGGGFTSITFLTGNSRGYKKDWCDEINTDKAMLSNFVENIKQQMFYQLWKFKLNTVLINHFIIENNLYGIWSPWGFLNVTLYT